MNLIAEGGTLEELSSLDSLYGEGETGKVRIYMDRNLSDIELVGLETQLVEKGVTLTEPIRQDARILEINFQRTSLPLLIIAGVVGTVIVGVIGWQVFSAIGEIPWWAWAVGIFGVGFLMLRKKGWA